VEGKVALGEPGDFFRQDVLDHDLVAELGEAGTRGEPDGAGAEDGDVGHQEGFASELRSGRSPARAGMMSRS
jgi:hypothetical protein